MQVHKGEIKMNEFGWWYWEPDPLRWSISPYPYDFPDVYVVDIEKGIKELEEMVGIHEGESR